MPHVHCSKCHHEWESTFLEESCDWCGSPIGRVLEEETAFEKMTKIIFEEFGYGTACQE